MHKYTDWSAARQVAAGTAMWRTGEELLLTAQSRPIGAAPFGPVVWGVQNRIFCRVAGERLKKPQ
jgi:hypothetical protein